MEKLDIVLQKTLTEYNKEIAARYKSLKGLIPSLIGYATERWVKEQNYLTGLSVQGLSDVVLTDLKEGQVLSYINGKWVNANAKGGGIDDETLAKLVTTDTVQTITGVKTFTTDIILTNGGIYGEAPTTTNPHSHAIKLGHAGNDKVDFCEYGALWNFYKSQGTTDTLVAKIAEGGITANSFIKSGGTASQFLKADGSVDSNGYLPLSGGTMTGRIYFSPTSSIGLHSNENYLSFISPSTKKTILFGDDNLRPLLEDAGNIALGTSSNRWSNVYTNTINVSSNALVSNLNADLLDGYHELAFLRYRGDIHTNFVDLTDTSINHSYYANYSLGLYRIARSDASELFINLAINDGSTSALQIKTSYKDVAALQFRKTIDSNRVSGPWRTILTELNIGNYNAGSATKLQTARTIWGQSFDGSGNVSGNIVNAGTITPSATDNYDLGSTSLKWRYGYFSDGLGVGMTTKTSGIGVWLNNDGGIEISHKTTPYIDFHYAQSSSDNTSRIIENASGCLTINDVLYVVRHGNVGIDTTSPTYKLHVVGTGYFTGYVDFVGGAGNSGSDMRFKSRITPLPSVLTALREVDIFSYIWHKDGERERDTFGVSADQFLKMGGIFAKMVHTRDDEYQTKWLDYERVGVLALKGVQELYEIILRQDERIKELERRVA